jgi:hypothetical protein
MTRPPLRLEEATIDELHAAIKFGATTVKAKDGRAVPEADRAA